MIRAVIFDLDGTLYNEKSFVKSGFRAVSAYLASKYPINENVIFSHLIRNFERGLRGKNFDVLIKEFGLTKEKVIDLVDIYRTHKPEIKLYTDAKILLSYLRSKQYKLGLITDGHATTQRNKIKALGLTNYFDAIIITEELGKGFLKPSVKSYKLMLHKLNVKPEECVYIGDNPLKDFLPAKKLDITTVRVKRGEGFYDSIEVPKELDADYQVANLLAIPSLIEKLRVQTKNERSC